MKVREKSEIRELTAWELDQVTGGIGTNIAALVGGFVALYGVANTQFVDNWRVQRLS
jgi:lactobin A/cerein 7B family class IIb bacteriocin